VVTIWKLSKTAKLSVFKSVFILEVDYKEKASHKIDIG